MDEALSKLYYDPKEGLLSAEKLYQKTKVKNINVTRKQVKEFLSNQETSQIFHKQRVKTYYPLQASTPFDRIQIDLMDMSNNNDHSYKWIFCCIDVYSRYAFTVALKNKSEEQCLSAFKIIIKLIVDIYGFLPSQLDSDKESAFISKKFRSLCKDYGIRQNISDINDVRAKAVVERFNRTLRGLINRYQTAYHTREWLKALSDLTLNYNSTIHSRLKTTPINAIISNEYFENAKVQQAQKAKKQSYNHQDIRVGDKVRLLVRKGLFDKEGTSFTKSTHIISNIEGLEYYVSDRVYPYKKYELLKITQIDQYKPVSNQTVKEDIQKETAEAHTRRTNRRINKEGINPKEDIIKDIDARALRQYRKPRDMGFFISQ